MAVKYFVDENLIPDDGSKDVLAKLDRKITYPGTELYVYPDVHYKNGARVVNGLLIKSRKYIYPACLGVENCGFTLGYTDKEASQQKLAEAAGKFAEKSFERKKYSENYILHYFAKCLRRDFKEKRSLYEAIGYHNADVLIQDSVHYLKRNRLAKLASDSLCSLGGGNHFIEIHKFAESKEENLNGRYMVIVHSDSVSVGDRINLLYSNLSELDYLESRIRIKSKLKYRLMQMYYFTLRGIIFKSPFELINMCVSQKDYRSVKWNTPLGRDLLFAHNIASVFGEMNRRELLRSFSNTAGIKISPFTSHCHDNVTIETYQGKKYVIHRNGVQKAGSDEYFVLPQAMGKGLILMKNPKNEKAFYSANHGTGRFKDKPAARCIYSEDETEKQLINHHISLFRVGSGNLAEQNYAAFKDIDAVAEQMEKYHLGTPIARTVPIAVIKG